MGNCILVLLLIMRSLGCVCLRNEDVHRLTDHAVAGDCVIDLAKVCMTKMM